MTKTDNRNFYAVIMAGGTGTRLWPLSRKEKPKQFQKFLSSKTMIQETYDRVAKVTPKENIFVSTTVQYKSLALEQLPEVKENQLIIEPLPRGTAAAIALVAQRIYEINPKAVIATVASDHAIKNADEFTTVISLALETAEKNEGKLVVVGINPTFADTGLGYIKMGKEFSSQGDHRIFYVDSFAEKPDKKTAEKYLAGWEYLWNAGYFIFSAQSFLGWTKKFATKIYEVVADEKNAAAGKLEEEYKKLENEPVEPPIVEKLGKDQRLVVPSQLQWSDVGNWGSLYDFLKNDLDSSMIVKGNHIDAGSEDCFIHSEKRLIATVGLRDTIVIETEDAILVADRKNVGEVKKIIEKLKEQGKMLYL